MAPELPSQVRILPWWLRYAPTRILYLDDFEGVLKWVQSVGTVARTSGLDTFEGTYHLGLTTGATKDDVVLGYVSIGYVPPYKFALQLRWHCYESNDAILQYFLAELAFYTGTELHRASIIYNKNLTTPQNKWQYRGADGGFYDIPSGAEVIDTTHRAHEFLYWTVDMSAAVKKYKRLVTSSLDLDLSTLSYEVVDSAETPSLSIILGAYTDVNQAAHCHVDALCLSDREP